MRRSMLTATPAPFVGGLLDAEFAGVGNDSFSVAIMQMGPTSFPDISRAGKIQEVSVDLGTGSGTFALIVAEPVGLVVRSISEDITKTGSGKQTYTLSTPLDVSPGDYIGIWTNVGTGTLTLGYKAKTSPAGGWMRYRSSNTVKPSVGSDLDDGFWISSSAFNRVMAVQIKGY